MKKTIAILLALVTILALAGCGVTSRQYRRYSYNPPASDRTLNDGTLYDETTNTYVSPRTRSTIDGFTHSGRNNPGAPNRYANNNTTRMINPGDAPLYDGSITRNRANTTQLNPSLNNTTLNDKMSRAAS